MHHKYIRVRQTSRFETLTATMPSIRSRSQFLHPKRNHPFERISCSRKYEVLWVYCFSSHAPCLPFIPVYAWRTFVVWSYQGWIWLGSFWSAFSTTPSSWWGSPYETCTWTVSNWETTARAVENLKAAISNHVHVDRQGTSQSINCFDTKENPTHILSLRQLRRDLVTGNTHPVRY